MQRKIRIYFLLEAPNKGVSILVIKGSLQKKYLEEDIHMNQSNWIVKYLGIFCFIDSCNFQNDYDGPKFHKNVIKHE